MILFGLGEEERVVGSECIAGWYVEKSGGY